MKIKPKETVLKMPKYDPPLENRRGKLRLDFNENPVGCSPEVLKMFKSLTREDIAIYPEYENFKKKVVKYYDVGQDQFVLTNGTDEGIKLIIDTYVSSKDEVLIPIPTFSMFEIYAAIIGCKITKVLYNPDFSFPTENLLDSISDTTKLIILANPNNPTGTVINDKDIMRIIECAAQKGILVFLDEAYYDFYGKTFLPIISKFSNLIISRTFSKAYGLAGLRLGLLFSDSYNVDFMKRVLSPYSVNNLAVMAANVALDDKEFVDNFSKMIKENREYMIREFKKLQLKVIPSQTNFLIVNFGDSCDIVEKKLREHDILVRNRSGYPLLKNCLRVGIGTRHQCDRLLEAIETILNKEQEK